MQDILFGSMEYVTSKKLHNSHNHDLIHLTSLGISLQSCSMTFSFWSDHRKVLLHCGLCGMYHHQCLRDGGGGLFLHSRVSNPEVLPLMYTAESESTDTKLVKGISSFSTISLEDGLCIDHFQRNRAEWLNYCRIVNLSIIQHKNKYFVIVVCSTFINIHWKRAGLQFLDQLLM